jgi:hypothetical protein
MRLLVGGLIVLMCGHAGAALARDELSTSARTAAGDTVPYVLTSTGEGPRYAVILMPGGGGQMSPRMENGKLAFGFGGNFLIASRGLFATGPFVAASTDVTTTPDRIMAIVRDLESRYGKLSVYVAGTSKSTEATIALSKPLDGLVAGFIHTSSVNGISGLDPRNLKSRHLIVSHRMDACRVTSPSAGAGSHRNYGTDFIVIEGGTSVGDDCEPASHHGFNGVTKETVDKIKAWIMAGK